MTMLSFQDNFRFANVMRVEWRKPVCAAVSINYSRPARSSALKLVRTLIILAVKQRESQVIEVNSGRLYRSSWNTSSMHEMLMKRCIKGGMFLSQGRVSKIHDAQQSCTSARLAEQLHLEGSITTANTGMLASMLHEYTIYNMSQM